MIETDRFAKITVASVEQLHQWLFANSKKVPQM
jgi:hypothetical protein